ncbi:hypothetical protein PV10_08271 [Exophiala mesophila]|uniref:Zn(2)-C6 fungal-type domain-containing protein n=1 Tax=Exophiala mesophila TaxID=212818 RepID=A0A0D1Z3Y5_EXOME|nr:uncharacterized protein PV10_08271 [Exophiala mesophila]KIV88604.1 hypothetical protein PV10_08271 [Exophiala mesophila]
MERPRKRIRQACEPCRRKKAKCLGERPSCSLCRRLDQECTYAPHRGRADLPPRPSAISTPSRPTLVQRDDETLVTEERLDDLEHQIAQMRSALRRPAPPSQSSPSLSPTVPVEHDSPSLRAPGRASSNYLPPWQTTNAIIELYIKYCNCQPLPLFSPQHLRDTVSSRDPELLLALISLAARFSSDSEIASSTAIVEESQRLVATRVSQGPVELSTIQTLCILSLREFNHGNTPKANVYSSLATSLSQGAGLSSKADTAILSDVGEERRRCYWSVVLLQRLYGYPSGSFLFVIDDKIPQYPQSAAQPFGTSSDITDAALAQSEVQGNLIELSDLGITSYAIQLSKVWQRAARYAHRRYAPSALPPWSAQSEYSKITAQLMELETRLPYKYRFRPSRFADQDSEQLWNNRAFWAPWVFVQMIYHSIVCLLNHPLLMALRLRSFRVTMVPEIFLQHTADMTITHTDWIVYLLDLCNDKLFTLSDPFLAHFVAIAATIFLQQSYTDDAVVKSARQQSFSKCLTFVQKIGTKWPNIRKLAGKMEAFEQEVSTSFHNSAAAGTPNSSIFIDLKLFWDIIESSFVSELPRAADSYFGTSLILHRHQAESSEVLRSHLLPEPMRLNHETVTPATVYTGQTPVMSRAMENNPFDSQLQFPAAGGLPEDGLSILAQSYFAQGQDFVGTLDDWWFSVPGPGVT